MRRTATMVLMAVSAVTLPIALGGLASAGSAHSTPSRLVASASESGNSGASRTKTKTVSRVHLDDDKQIVVDERKVSVSVDQLSGLRDRQALRVSWTGAHPTGGIVADQNSGGAAYAEEYPMLLIQCRGVDSQQVPAKQRIRPETCWTQTPFERFYNTFGNPYPAWRLDRYSSKQERQRYVNEPKNRPAQCFSKAETERWVPFEAQRGTYPGGPNGCGGTAPEATEVGSLNLPSNTTYAATGKNGKGSAVFNVRSEVSNASLGCSDRVPCSLVVIPIMGISCDVDSVGLSADEQNDPELKDAADKCRAKGVYKPGENRQPSLESDPAVTASMWWSESNWRNRLTFPLNFTRTAASCDVTNAGGEGVFGSELMIQAMVQWNPVFCLDKRLTPITHVQTGEPQARNLYTTGTIDAALISHSPESTVYPRPTVKAPVAATGFSIAFTIDDDKGKPVRQLRLSPRLLAKLMTMSYPSNNAVRTEYDALSGNPLNVAADPEFQALNPSVPDSVGAVAASTLLNLSSDSDVMWALTSYIDADPEARAWLDGEPDPWGMKVNPNYKGIELPTETWQSLDDFKPLSLYRPGVNDCLYQNPVPYLPLVASPLTRLSYIALAMQFSISQSQVICQLPSFIPGDTSGAKMVAQGRQTPGFRFMIGVTSLADADRYELNTASLETYVDSSAPKDLSSLKGRTFVSPTDQSLREAVSQLQPDTATQMWDYDYDKVRQRESAARAYPGLMVVYAVLPTEGLDEELAATYADWLQYVVTEGQKRGDQLGELPGGYLPVTEQNGMLALRESSLCAAESVKAQNGGGCDLDDGTGPDGKPTRGPGTGGTSFSGGSGTDSGSGDQAQGADSGGDHSGDEVTALEPLGQTVSEDAGFLGYAVPGLLCLALLAGIVSGVVIARDRWLARRSP